MGKLEKYTSYKNYTIPWIETLPSHWSTKKIKYFAYTKGRIGFHGLNSNEFLYDEGPYLITGSDFKNTSIDWSNCRRVTEKRYEEDKNIQIKNGDFLITKDGTIGKTAIVQDMPYKATLNSGVLLVRANQSICHTGYLYWLVNSNVFKIFIDLKNSGATVLHLYQNDFNNFDIPLPPKDEQYSITSFLNTNVTKINNSISQKEKLIELLKEKKHITINDAVTKGLNKNVEFVDSGVEWIGKIPKHWKLERLGSNFIERKEKVSDKDFEPLSVTKNGIVPQLDSAAKSNDGDNRKLVRNGDFVINSRSDRKGSSGLSKMDGSVSLINIVLKPIKIEPKFSHHVFKSYKFVEEFYRNGHGIVADLWTTRFWDMKSIMLAIPPKDEQIQIVEYIEEQTIKIDKAIELQQKYILKLKEYKASLIDSLVTGKVRVA